jgi:hypothetical protein
LLFRFARHRGNPLGDDRLRGRDVFLHEDRRDRQHVANVVEAVARVVRGKFLFGLEIDADEVLDRVAVLDAVQAAHGHAAGVRVRRVDREYLVFDPVLEVLLLGGRKVRVVFGGHQPRAHVDQHLEPQRLVEDLLRRLEAVEGDLALVVAVAVAFVTMLFEHRSDALFIFRHRGRFGGGQTSGHERHSHCRHGKETSLGRQRTALRLLHQLTDPHPIPSETALCVESLFRSRSVQIVYKGRPQ